MEAKAASDGGGEVDSRGERIELIFSTSPLRESLRTTAMVESVTAGLAVERWRRRRWRVVAKRAITEDRKYKGFLMLCEGL